MKQERKKLRWSIEPKARFFERLTKTHKLSETMIKRQHTLCWERCRRCRTDTEGIFQMRRLLCIAALWKSEGEIKTACNKNCHWLFFFFGKLCSCWRQIFFCKKSNIFLHLWISSLLIWLMANIYEKYLWTSLVVQWLGTHLLMQRTWVWSLVWEDSTCCRATKPMSHNYWSLLPRAHAPQ